MTEPPIASEVFIGDLSGSIGVREDLGKPRWWGPVLCLTLLSVIYLVATCLHAAREKLWFDELWTFKISTLPSLRALWTYLSQGVEFTPPLGFLLSTWSERIFGSNEFGVRFPSVIAFWVMALCLYVYLRRWLPWPFAIAGMLLPALTAAGRYSYEARPYALALAFAGIALVAWQAAAEGRRRGVALVALAVALASALSSSTFAVTLALPFLMGEIARTIQRRRVDWPVWCAFASATPALLVLWKLKAAGDPTSYCRFNGTISQHIVTSYLQILMPAIVPLGLVFLSMLVLRSQVAGSAKRAPGIPAHALAALSGFALIPFIAVPLSILGCQYYLRYSLNCTIGLAGLLAILLFRIGGANRLAGATALAVFGVCFTIGQFLPEDMRADSGLKLVNTSERIQPFLEGIPSDAPIVICWNLTFIELEHYSGSRLADRLYYLTDPAAAAAIDGDTFFEVKGSRDAQYFPFRAHFEDYHSFVAAHKRFYVVQPMRNIAWEHSKGRLSLQPRETADHFQYYEATPH
jgi:hypothetical protein